MIRADQTVIHARDSVNLSSGVGQERGVIKVARERSVAEFTLDGGLNLSSVASIR